MELDAFFDILLVALKLGTKGKFWLRARQDKLVSVKDQAYADDSLTPCSDIAEKGRYCLYLCDDLWL